VVIQLLLLKYSPNQLVSLYIACACVCSRHDIYNVVIRGLAWLYSYSCSK